MPYRLRMSAEIGDWIADLCSSAPGSPESLAATEVGAALAAALSAADLDDLAVITDLAAQAEPVDDSDLRAGVDYMYQRLLEELQRLRLQVAIAAGFRTTTRHRITKTGSEPAPFSPAEIAAAEKRQRALTKQTQRWQAAVDAFRTVKEVAKARITAAEGRSKVQLVLLETAAEAGGDTAEVEQAKSDLAAAEASLLEAKAQAVDALAQARRLLLALRRDVGKAEADAGGSGEDDRGGDSQEDQADGADGPGVAAGLLELRADPLGADVRILCAVEPPGTLTLLAALEGADAIRAHRERAIRLAGDLLAEIRAEDVPQDESPGVSSDTAPGELTFTGAAPFLARYFPDSGGPDSDGPNSRGEVERRAAALAAATTLRALRRRHGLTFDDLQARTGMQAHQLWELETGGLRSARLSEVAAYLRALEETLTLQTGDGTAVIG